MRTAYLTTLCLSASLSSPAFAGQSHVDSSTPEPVVTVPPARTVEPVGDAKPPSVANAEKPGVPKKSHHPRESMTAQAGDPTAPLVQAQMTYFYSDVVRNSSDSAAQFNIQPVIPLPPNKLVPMGQLIRPNVPFQDAPDGKSGLADISVEHIFLPEPEPWGALGFGYTLTLPTADHRDLGAGKYQLGPAATIVYYGVKNWQMGFTLTQSWSIAGVGKSDREDVSEFTAQPILNYLVGPWYIGLGDFTYSYNWKGNEGWTIPLGLQVGHVSKIGKHHYNLSVEALWGGISDGSGPSPERGIKLGFVLLLPE